MPELDTGSVVSRLSAMLGIAGRKYPSAWKQFDQFRADRGTKVDNWPNWCFCPLAGATAIITTQFGVSDTLALAAKGDREFPPEDNPANDISRMGALAAWRCSQGVYVIDPDVAEALNDTAIDRTLPVDVLFNLPQWGVYIPTPGLEIDFGFKLDRKMPVVGFFAFLEYDVNTHKSELRLLIDYAEEVPFSSLMVESLILEAGKTVQECFEAAIESGNEQHRALGVDETIRLEITGKLLGMGSKRLAPLLSRLLYLCSQTAEYRRGGESDFTRPGNPQPTKTKRDGWRFFVPDRPTVWHVGETIGKAIRQARTVERKQTNDRSGPRPHVRRAHWHGFWTGPKSGVQTFILKWLPPTAVALAEEPNEGIA